MIVIVVSEKRRRTKVRGKKSMKGKKLMKTDKEAS